MSYLGSPDDDDVLAVLSRLVETSSNDVEKSTKSLGLRSTLTLVKRSSYDTALLSCGWR